MACFVVLSCCFSAFPAAGRCKSRLPTRQMGSVSGSQCPERTPDALHRSQSPCTAVRTNTVRNAPERPTAPADDAGGKALASRHTTSVHRTGWTGTETPCPGPAGMLNAPEKKLPALPARQHGRRKESAAQQCRPPQSRTPRGPRLVLQKAADDTPYAERRNEDAKGIARPLLAQAVLLHHRLSETRPTPPGMPGEHLNGCARRKDGPRACFAANCCFIACPPNGFSLTVCPFQLTKRQIPL